MKNSTARALSIAYVIGMGFGFTSCKDDEPPVPPKLSFTEATRTVAESDGVIEVALNLDRAYGKDLNVEYSLTGTASDQHTVGDVGADYKIVGNRGVVTIKGEETSGAIKIEILNDGLYEADETIEISIIDVNTSDVQVGTPDKMTVTITSDDAEAIASFQTTTLTVNEGDGVGIEGEELVAVPVNVPVHLDKAASGDVVVKYAVKIDLTNPQRNDAIDSTWAHANGIPGQYYDYYIEGATSTEQGIVGEVVVPAGSTTANIEIMLLVDFMLEDNETIEITLTESAGVSLGTNKTAVVTVEEQDGKAIVLLWDEAYTDVDMDMFLWLGPDTTNLDRFLLLGITPSVTDAELIFLPSLFFSEGAYGLSYIYYEGSADPMNFEVRFIDFKDGVVEPNTDWDIFNGSYSQANINPWDQEGVGTFPPAIAQRFVVNNGVYAYGKLQVPTSGSRMKPKREAPPTRKRDSRFTPRLRSIF